MSVEAKVGSIGVDGKGAAVIRVVIDRRMIEVPTNVVGLAKLAEAGINVVNEMIRRK